jgi:hypothetical protein
VNQWEIEFRYQVELANRRTRVGDGQAPWEVVMEEVIKLRNELVQKNILNQDVSTGS